MQCEGGSGSRSEARQCGTVLHAESVLTRRKCETGLRCRWGSCARRRWRARSQRAASSAPRRTRTFLPPQKLECYKYAELLAVGAPVRRGSASASLWFNMQSGSFESVEGAKIVVVLDGPAPGCALPPAGPAEGAKVGAEGLLATPKLKPPRPAAAAPLCAGVAPQLEAVGLEATKN